MNIKTNRHLIYALVIILLISILFACNSTSTEAQTNTISNETTTAEVTSTDINNTDMKLLLSNITLLHEA